MASYTKTISRNALFLTTLSFLILTISKPVASQCNCPPDLCCSRYGYCGQTDEFCGVGCQSGPCKNNGPGDPTVSLEETVTPDFFNAIKNQAGDNCAGKTYYTHEAFINAAKSYPNFGTPISKREIAAFFAHVTQETGFMCYTEEIDGPTMATSKYCDDTKIEFPCVPGKGYYGRGPIQLTWNYNYGPTGKELNEDLLASPEKVLQDPVFAFKTAFSYWTRSVRSSFKSGFGATIKAINDMECGGTSAEAANRIKYFQEYCKQLGVEPGTDLNC